MSYRSIDTEGLAAVVALLDHHGRYLRQATSSIEWLAKGRGARLAPVSLRSERISGELAIRCAIISNGQRIALAGSQVPVSYAATTDLQSRLAAESELGFDLAASLARIEEVIERTRERLSQSWRDWDVSNGDLQNILTDMSSLQLAELNAVIAGLTSDELKRWFKEMTNSFNGFSRSEKGQVFEVLAQCDATNLAKIFTVLEDTHRRDDVVDFSWKVQAVAGDRVLVDLIEILRIRQGTDAGIMMATALTGLDDPKSISRALRSLASDDERWGHVMLGALISGHSDLTPKDVGRLDPLATALKANDPAAKALIFAATIRIVSSGGALPPYLRARVSESELHSPLYDIDGFSEMLDHSLTALITSDPSGVVTALRNEADPSGTATAVWIGGTLQVGDFDSVVDVIHRLRNTNSEVDIVWFSHREDDSDLYPNATNLAYLSGTLSLAVKAESESAESKINLITFAAGIALVALGLGATVPDLAASILNGGSGGAVDYFADKEVDQIHSELADLLELIEESNHPVIEDISIDPSTVPEAFGIASYVYDEELDRILGR